MNVIVSLLMAWAQPPVAPVMSPHVAPKTSITPPPVDWSTLPTLRYLHRPSVTPELSLFVRDEVAAGRCTVGLRSTSGSLLSIDLAVLVTPTGQVRRIVPRAIDCPTVEQYAWGIASRLARNNVDAGGIAADTWFRTTMNFTWTG